VADHAIDASRLQLLQGLLLPGGLQQLLQLAVAWPNKHLWAVLKW
jgi:hypothetical protein